MTTSTLTITDFLLARIAEDEAVARSKRRRGDFYDQPCPSCGEPVPTIGSPWDDHYVFHVEHSPFKHCELSREQVDVLMPDLGPTPEGIRALAECEAKRRIVGLHEPVDHTGLGMQSPNACSICGIDAGMSDWEWVRNSFPCDTLRALAAVYADHPDYREEWRP